jgi:CRP/FNR family transcriptional regulator, cyclic AMP receptor protein
MTDTSAYSLGHIAKLLSSGTAFANMPMDEALRVAEMMVLHEYQAGEILTQEGQTNQGQLMLVVHGEVKVTSKLINAMDSLVYRTASAGHLVGEVGFIDGQPHSATSTATGLVHVAILPRPLFVALLEQQPFAAAQLMAGLLKIMAQRVRHANMTIQTLGVVHKGLQEELDRLRGLVGKK